MPRGPKKQRLNIFLLKEGTTLPQAVRDDVGELSSFAISEEFAFRGEIKVKTTRPLPTTWQQFVRSGTQEAMPDLVSQSSGALILLTVDDRVFCVAWGNGRHWIDDKRIERRFGMIVTLNTVDPQQIRSVDREEFETVTRMTRSQLSVSSTIDSFGLDVQRDLVRSVTGTPEDRGFAAHVTGSDNLVLHVAITFGQLGIKCREVLRHYGEDRYKNNGFGWIDNFVRVRDRLLIGTLENQLQENMRAGPADNVFLSPPIIIESQEHYGFRYPGERRGTDLHSDLRLEEFFQGRDRDTITSEWLKKHKIREFTNDAETLSREFSIFDAIVYEVRVGTKLYVLSQGEWFEIDEDYVTQVSNELAQIEENENLQLPDARPGELEPAYNRRTAETSGGALALLDVPDARINYGGGRSVIEVCDLLSLNRDFVHVKAKTKSSTLSHLFAQGTNSAQAFRDVRFRQLAGAACPATHRHVFTGADIRAADHSVTFAIITRFEGLVRDALPFFSKQSLVNSARALRDMGYRVYTRKISIAPPGVGEV
jgi:uncharacterized protein (TIGR04141 family)